MTKEEKLIYDRAWRAKNRDKTRLSAKKWRENHLEESKARIKACRIANPLPARKSNKKWAQKNKVHRKEYMRTFRKANRKHHNETRNIWARKNKRATKSYDLKKNYGIDINEYERLLVAQENRCAVCTIHKDELAKVLCVDHCHETGFIRGLVCSPCNKALGFLRNSPELCNNAVSYLNTAKWKIFISDKKEIA